MISEILSSYTFSEPRDIFMEYPLPLDPFGLDRAQSPDLEDTADHIVSSEVLEVHERKRSIDEMEPTPIGPRTSVTVVDEVAIEHLRTLDCEDFLVEALKPMLRSEHHYSDMTKIEFEPCLKRRKLATVTPSSSFSFDQVPCSLELSLSEQENNNLAKPDQWYEKYQELCDFYEQYGHCMVPNKTPEGNYQSLSQWVKRQRHQHKLKRLGRHSTLTEDREAALRKLDFVWDSHGATWNERFSELLAYKAARGHCNVPTDFPENPQLSIWVKCQRRQYKLHLTGKKSNINSSRIAKLNEIGFVWNPRNLKV